MFPDISSELYSEWILPIVKGFISLFNEINCFMYSIPKILFEELKISFNLSSDKSILLKLSPNEKSGEFI